MAGKSGEGLAALGALLAPAAQVLPTYLGTSGSCRQPIWDKEACVRGLSGKSGEGLAALGALLASAAQMLPGPQRALHILPEGPSGAEGGPAPRLRLLSGDADVDADARAEALPVVTGQQGTLRIPLSGKGRKGNLAGILPWTVCCSACALQQRLVVLCPVCSA